MDMEKLKALKAQQFLEVDLGEIDEMYEGLTVTMTRAYMLPYAIYMKLWMTMDDDKSDYDRAVERLKYHVLEWNLPDLSKDTWEVLPIPKVNAEVLTNMRTEWVNFLGGKLMMDYQASMNNMGEVLEPGETSSEDTSENPTSSDQDSLDNDISLMTSGI